MSLSRLLYIANLLVILSFFLHLCPVSRTADHVTCDAVGSAAGEFYCLPDTWTLSCPGPDASCHRIAGHMWGGAREGDEEVGM